MKVCIIGAGPAGLAAASGLTTRKDCEVILFDAGKISYERDHNNADDLGVGIGGAGLFSDGKFSFFPSGTNVYKLNNKDLIKEGYTWICEELKKVGIESFQYNISSQTDGEGNFTLKDYPSTYGSLMQRKKLIDNLIKVNNCQIKTNCHVSKIEKVNNQYQITYYDSVNKISLKIMADSIIIASGRLGNLAMPTMLSSLPIKTDNIRYEIGIRIESKSNLGFLNKIKNPDVKAIWKTKFGEIRTFCTCRNGEVWNIPYDNLSALSGRSDGPKTEFSNFGFLIRFTNDYFSHGQTYFNNILKSVLLQDRNIGYQSLKEFLGIDTTTITLVDKNHRPWHPKNKFVISDSKEIMGNELHEVFKNAINSLIEWSPELLNDETTVLFPSIEGTGIYPLLDDNLRIAGENIWCCGDLAGKFRGIIPAFVSGYYAAKNLHETLDKKLHCEPARISDEHLNSSTTLSKIS